MNHEAVTPLAVTPFLPQRPVTILIATLGSEYGSALADWLVAAAQQCGYPVQCTSNPDVSPRTGSTTYYVEIYPVSHTQLGGRTPVMALKPTPGMVDMVVATELVEAGRALQGAYIDAERTMLVASTHRVYTVAEKVIPGDGRTDGNAVLAALRASSPNAVLFDMAQMAQENACVIDAVLLGALAASDALPLSRESCEQAIRESSIAVAADIRGFTAGYDYRPGQSGVSVAATQTQSAATPVERVHQRFPEQTFFVLDTGVARMIDYQDAAYATLYLDRLDGILALDREAGGAETGYQLTREAGRQLALWMSFEDAIRVADLKTRTKRFDRVRTEVGATPEDVVVVTEYLKFGLEELFAILPQGAANRLKRWTEKLAQKELHSVSMHIKTTDIFGFLLLRGLSCLRPWRRHTARYLAEQARIERWLGAIKRLGFAVQDVELALEIVECARLIEGYGETRRSGIKQFEAIFDKIIESGTESDPKKLSAAIRRARLAALSNPDAAPAVQKSMNSDPGKPIFWMPRATPVKSGCNTGAKPMENKSDDL